MLAARSPVALVAVTALLWGTMWLPSRWMERLGEGSLWPWLTAFALPVLLLSPVLVRRRRSVAASGALAWFAAAMFALALALFPEALLRGTVARAVLLFPASLVGWWFLSEALGIRRVLAVLLGVAGLVALFGLDAGWPVPRGPADWMALASGLAWSAALTARQRLTSGEDIDLLLATCVALALAFAAVSLAPGGRETAWPIPQDAAPLLAAAQAATLLTAALLLAMLWLLPITWITIHAAGRLQPGRLSLILLLEILVGIASAALLGDEMPGRGELTGMAFIGGAILCETLPLGRRAAPTG